MWFQFMNMITQKNLELLKKQHYYIAGKHSAVQICRWTKKSLISGEACYKHKFYGIPSWRCCEISPSAVFCDNHCLHCWRAIENTQGNKILREQADKPEKIIEECIIGRRKLLSGFGGRKKIDIKKYKESLEPSHFAISLIGEPTIYPYIGEMIELLQKKGKTTFLVTNGLHPKVLKKLEKKNQLPTQLYISLNSPNKEEYKKWHKSKLKDAWKRFNESLEIMKKLKNKTRTVIRMTLVKDRNMKKEQIADYAKLIKKANPLFLECKGFMSVGFARKRLGYKTMPTMKEVEDFAKMLEKATGLNILDKQEFSRVVLLGKPKDKRRMKIRKEEI